MKNLLTKAIPHLIAIGTFLIISISFYHQALFGKQMKMGDIDNWKGMAKELIDYREATGEEALWLSNGFSGMPAYQVSVSDMGNAVKWVDKIYRLWLPRPIDILFKAMLGFYILMMCMRVNPLIGAIGAVSFGLSTVFILYIGAGHASKMASIAYIAPMLGGVIYAFRKNALKGSALVALFLCLHLGSNHLQMTYYAFIMILVIGIGELIRKILNKETHGLPKTIGFLAIAGILGVLPNYSLLATTAEYGDYSTRGNSELTIKAPNQEMETTTGNGLAKDYILEYNMAHGEWLSAFSPKIKGGKPNYLPQDEVGGKALGKNTKDALGYFANQRLPLTSYWGEQKSTGGAYYFGALMFFLAVLALFFLKDTIRWPLLAVAIISILASWKLGSIPDFFIDYIPLWDKFRDTKMMLILLMLIIPFLGSLFLNQFFGDTEFRQKFRKKILYVSGGFLLLVIFMMASPQSIFDFSSTTGQADQIILPQLKEALGKKAINEIEEGRMAVFSSGVKRSLVITILGIGLLFLSFFKKEWNRYIPIGLGIIFLLDLWLVDLRYFNGEESFDSVRSQKTPFPATKADASIVEFEKSSVPDFDQKVAEVTKIYQEKTGDKRNPDNKKLERKLEALTQNSSYRVLDLLGRFSSSRASYYHKSIGGYHGAKLKNYQELIDFYITDEINTIYSQITQQQPIQGNFPILNMLNTKYLIIGDNDAIPLQGAMGNAWFVNGLKKVPTADSEMESLAQIDIRNTAVIQDKYADGLENSYSGSGNISLKSFSPNEMIYSVDSSEKNYAVFSEIHYPEGWNAYVDGQPAEHAKVNYTLRGLEIPAGSKEVVFKFEPSTFFFTKNVSFIGSLILLLLLLGIFLRSNKGLVKKLND